MRPGGPFRALRAPSGALLHGACLWSKGYQFRQPHEVVGGAAEDEQPIDLVQSAQLHLADRAGLLEPSKSLFDQPSAAQADGVAGMPRGSAIEVCRVVLRSRFERRPFSFFVTCAVTFKARVAAMKSFVS